jgi:phage/plasmid-associated DNA primase
VKHSLPIKFDKNADLFGFNNGVYDLIKYEFREIRYDDYITMSCGYDYNPDYDEESMVEMRTLLGSVMPDDAIRALLLEVMSAGLTGRVWCVVGGCYTLISVVLIHQCLLGLLVSAPSLLCEGRGFEPPHGRGKTTRVFETFVLFNGGGRNGKGVLDELLKVVYGDYCLIYANVSLLTEKQKTGGNPELASINNKRIVIMKEPDEGEALQNSNIKSITGGGNVSGRMLYSNKTNVELALILVMECNTRPKFKSDPGVAEIERVLDIFYPNRFTQIEEEIDNISTFRINSLYKTKEWQESHRDAFLQILIKSYKDLQERNYAFKIPETVANRTESYLNQSLGLFGIFNELYVKSGKKGDKNIYVALREVYDQIIISETFCHFSHQDKRRYNYQYFLDFIKTHKLFTGLHKPRYRQTTNVLMGYISIDDIPMAEDEEEEEEKEKEEEEEEMS